MPGQRACADDGRDERAIQIIAKGCENLSDLDGLDLIHAGRGPFAAVARSSRLLQIGRYDVGRLGMRGRLPGRGLGGILFRHARLGGAVAGHRRLHRRTEARQHRKHGDNQGGRRETTRGGKMWVQGRYFSWRILPPQDRNLLPSSKFNFGTATGGLQDRKGGRAEGRRGRATSGTGALRLTG